MVWSDGLLEDQRRAASQTGGHARMLAGPGTGKTLTLTRRIVYLIMEEEIPSNEILALTFTRAAAAELRGRVRDALGEDYEQPRISTLHSFALRQLLRNASRITTLPQPLRIADDWEERWIINEELKTILGLDRVSEVSDKFDLLSADWQTLDADRVDWESKFVDPRFLGAWREHRNIYGYTLRDELVYQLKRALEQTDDFILESDFSHLLIDEYQDLNPCDLAIVRILANSGIEVFAAGDDDQSIYGFRYANPEGIRQFGTDFAPATLLTLYQFVVIMPCIG